MKRFSALLLLSLSLSNYAQSYESVFENDSSKWSIVLEGVCDWVCSEEFSILGDTTIGSENYRVLKSESTNSIFVREDTVTGRIWSYHSWLETEYLVQDMSLNIGEEFIVYSDGTPNSIYVDTVYYIDGLKQIEFNVPIEWCGWIVDSLVFREGTGPSAGFNYQPYYYGSLWSAMICHSNDTSLLYETAIPFVEDCYICTVGYDEDRNKGIKVFPNPAHKSIVIDHGFNQTITIEIRNQSGKLLFSKPLVSSKDEVDVSHLSPGVYLMELKDPGGELVGWKKFVKQ